MSALRLLSWNVNGRVEDAAKRQIFAAISMTPDVVALQEITRRSADFWRAGLLEAGYSVLTSDPELLKITPPLLPHLGSRPKKRTYLNLIASKLPIASLPGLSFHDRAEAFPEKYLAARVSLDGAAIDVHNAHTPPGVSVKMLKVYYWEAMLARLEEPTDAAKVLCGDFNAPGTQREEYRVGTSHADDDDRRWDEAEIGFLNHPELRDVYRATRGPGPPYAVSVTTGWGWTRRIPRRYDQIYASKEFDLSKSECEYLSHLMSWPETVNDPDGLHEPPPEAREGLSDHAPVLATLRFSPPERLSTSADP